MSLRLARCTPRQREFNQNPCNVTYPTLLFFHLRCRVVRVKRNLTTAYCYTADKGAHSEFNSIHIP